MADVYERSPKRWYLRGRVNGKRLHVFVATTKSEALVVLKEFQKRKALDDLDLPDIPKKQVKTKLLFEDLAMRYLDHSHAEKSRKTYMSDLARINAHWLPLLKGRFIDDISPLEIQKWKEKRLNAGIMTHTVYSDLKVLKTMFARAKQWNMFSGENPVGKLPKTIRRQIRFLNPEECERYLECCSPIFYPIAAILIMTGIRIGELFELRWKDVDLDRQMLIIRPESSLKNEDGREIPINDQLIPIFQSLPRRAEFVFPGENANPQRTTCQHSHNKARKLAGFPDLKVHHLRHTFASLAIREGHDPATVSKLLGHKSIRVTMDIYHHLYPDQARKIINKIPIRLRKE